MPLTLYSSVFGQFWYGTPAPTGGGGGTVPVIGSYKPDATTTGLIPGVDLTVVSGDIVMSTPGQIIQNLDIAGYVKVTAANCQVINCRVRGSHTVTGTTNIGVIDAQSGSCKNLTVLHSLIQPDLQYISTGLTGILGHDYTMRYCNIANTVDGWGANTGPDLLHANIIFEGNYVHDLSYLDPDPNHPDDHHTHNDGGQIQYGGNIRVVGNNIEALAAAQPYSNTTSPYFPAVTGQAIGFTPNSSNIYNVLIQQNWLDGGAQPLTAIASYNADGSIKYNETNTIQVLRNRFGRKGHFAYGIRISPDAVGGFTGMRTTTGNDTTNGNVWDDDGTPVLVSIS